VTACLQVAGGVIVWRSLVTYFKATHIFREDDHGVDKIALEGQKLQKQCFMITKKGL
jgi:hypothetical protein